MVPAVECAEASLLHVFAFFKQTADAPKVCERTRCVDAPLLSVEWLSLSVLSCRDQLHSSVQV